VNARLALVRQITFLELRAPLLAYVSCVLNVWRRAFVAAHGAATCAAQHIARGVGAPSDHGRRKRDRPAERAFAGTTVDPPPARTAMELAKRRNWCREFALSAAWRVVVWIAAMHEGKVRRTAAE
jgi:hypothetical protein